MFAVLGAADDGVQVVSVAVFVFAWLHCVA
jgi:hypothetical protein